MDRPPQTLAPLEARTLAEAWQALAQTAGPDMVLDDGHGQLSRRAVGELIQDALRGAVALQFLEVSRGDHVIVARESGPDMLASLQAVALAGAVQIAFYPPTPHTPLPAYRVGLQAVLTRANPRFIWCAPEHRALFEEAAREVGLSPRFLTDVSKADPARYVPVAIAPDDLAMVQYTSGSTSQPKGVQLSHGAVMENLRALHDAAEFAADEVYLMWVPVQSNLGFMFCWLALLTHARLVWLPAHAVLASPMSWLWAIHRHQATFSVASNFLYQSLATTSDSKDGLDLSSWRSAGTGGEPVLWSTIQAFTEKFSPYGFQPGILRGGYGMTEMTFSVAYARRSLPLRVERLDAERLETDGRAVPVDPEAVPMRRLATYVSMGPLLPGLSARVVDFYCKLLGEREVGEIQLIGPSHMLGYLDDPLATEEAFHGLWYRTGDLGYMVDGELVIIGRRKDLIIKCGRKIVPQDLERLVERLPGILPGGAVAFGVPNALTGTEAAVMVVETQAPESCHEDLTLAIAQTLWEEAELRVDHVAIVPPGTLPRTLSHKVQRARARILFMGNKLMPG